MIATILSSVISCVVSFVLGGLLSFVATKSKRSIAHEKAERNGVRELLRSRLIEYHDRYTERKSCPVYVKEAVTKIYEAYHDLGGNGVITKLFNDIIALPEPLDEQKDGD